MPGRLHPAVRVPHQGSQDGAATACPQAYAEMFARNTGETADDSVGNLGKAKSSRNTVNMVTIDVTYCLGVAGTVCVLAFLLLGIWIEADPMLVRTTEPERSDGRPFLVILLAFLMCCCLSVGYYSGSVYHPQGTGNSTTKAR